MSPPRLDPDRLSGALADRLRAPPQPVHRLYRFAPQLNYGRDRGPAPPHARRAAVALLLYPRQDQWHIPFTLRPRTLTTHAGQVSLPGGAIDAGETPEACALRELHEEIGIPPDRLRLLGGFSPIYVYRSNYQVQPVVLIAPEPLVFRANPAEVEQLLEIPVPHLFNPQHYSRLEVIRQSLRFAAPCIRFESHRIWGATARIVGEFLAVAEGLFETGVSGLGVPCP